MQTEGSGSSELRHKRRTLLTRGDLPYIKTGEYRNALNSHAQIAIIALGTNDAKPQNRKFPVRV